MMLKTRYGLIASFLLWASAIAVSGLPQQSVPSGSAAQAETYYRRLAVTLHFTEPTRIFESTLDDVPKYLGYRGLSARDLQSIPPELLMNPGILGRPCQPQGPCAAVETPAEFQLQFGIRPVRPNDILAARFLAPKIANVSEGQSTRGLGWRQLIRLKARPDSEAIRNGIAAGVILFNFFTQPGETPFQPTATSVNTQVILVPTAASFGGGATGKDALYWLDYGPLAAGGKLSLKLDATFDAGDLQGATGAVKPYFVPAGCVACHGENPQRAMLNYLDTDHWFDRLRDDFARVREEGLPVLFDGGVDESTDRFASAFDVVRRFNEEAEAQAAFAQPRSFHRAAGRNWLRLHERSNAHVLPANRSVPAPMRWNPNSPQDVELIESLNRFCFRCHGTIKFNVFDRTAVFERRFVMAIRLAPTAAQLKANPAFLMPPDRRLADVDRDRLIRLLKGMEAK